MASHESNWVVWARKLQAIAQTGLTYRETEYDAERYEQINALAAEIMATYSEMDAPEILDFFAHDDGYATPKVDVRAAVFRDEKILLVRERRDGLWTLPGGFADVNDGPSEAAERETREESGFIVKATKLAMLLDKRHHEHPPSPRHTYKLFFLCDLIGGEATTSFETSAVDFFPLDGLPPLSLHRTLPSHIQRLFEHHHNPSLPTDFD